MGQGQAPPRRFYHTQEIAHEPLADEWQTLGQRTTEVVDLGDPQACGSSCKVIAPWGAPCCTSDDGVFSVEEVLVVHHDALRKVNFLLKVDELSGCELPSVPECVVAARRAELQKRQNELLKDTAANLLDSDEESDEELSAGKGDVGGPKGPPAVPPPACVPPDSDDGELGRQAPSSRSAKRTCGSGRAVQPSMREEDFDPWDGSGEDDLQVVTARMAEPLLDVPAIWAPVAASLPSDKLCVESPRGRSEVE